MTNDDNLAPVWALSHGSPMSLFEKQHPAHQHWIQLGKKIRSLYNSNKLKGIAIVSAHWQAEKQVDEDDDGKPFIQVNINEENPLIYDFYGFPKHYYETKFTSKNPNLFNKIIIETLLKSGYKVDQIDRGIDHGVWVPLKSAFGEQELEIPLIQISLPIEKDFLTDANSSFQLGNSLRSLREKGIAIIGTGQAVHNVRDFFQGPPGLAEKTYGNTFSKALEEVMMMDTITTITNREEIEQIRKKTALELLKRKDYKMAHPTQEHLSPFFVAFGASFPNEKGKLDFQYNQGSLVWDMYSYGT